MSGYHSFELCYLAATYTNLLITKQPLDLHFKPKPGGFKDDILRVAPDLLPQGSIRIESVTVDGKEYADFDADALTVKIPHSDEPVKIVVRVVPTEGLQHFTANATTSKGTATLVLTGDADHVSLPFLRAKLQEVIDAQPDTVVIRVKDLQRLTPAAIRALIFAKQKLRTEAEVQIAGASQAVKDALNATEFGETVKFVG
jgi:anti-anti-sigma factor